MKIDYWLVIMENFHFVKRGSYFLYRLYRFLFILHMILNLNIGEEMYYESRNLNISEANLYLRRIMRSFNNFCINRHSIT